MTAKALKDNGFPFPDPQPEGCAIAWLEFRKNHDAIFKSVSHD